MQLKMADTQTTSEPAAREKPSDDCDACYHSGPEVAMGMDNKQPGLEKEDSSVAVDVNAGERLKEHCEDQMSGTSEALWEPPLSHTAPGPGVADATLDQASAGMRSSLEACVCLRVDSSACPPASESCDNERQGQVGQGRRSSAAAAGPGAVERDQTDQQHLLPPSAEIQDEGAAAGADLAPWQADFNLEDVFKPVATRGQRSVRRSLRNQRSADSSGAGLAWLPQTSPDSVSGVRRRPRGRRLVAAPPTLLEET